MIKVYTYKPDDLEAMRFNRYARKLEDKANLKRIKAFLDIAEAYTLFDKKTVAVLGIYEYEPGSWFGCIIADNDFGVNFKYAIRMKRLIGQLVEIHQPKTVQTISDNELLLNKWHHFLGFKEEKKLENNTILWSMTWE